MTNFHLIKRGNKKMNDIKYPKTELFVVLGTKVYPLYTTEDPEFVHNLLTNVEITKF